MELFPQVVTSARGELRILSYIYMELFAKIIENKKPFTIFAKTSIFDVRQGLEYASQLAFKVKDASFLNQLKYQR